MESTARRSSTITRTSTFRWCSASPPLPSSTSATTSCGASEFNREDDALDFEVVTELVFSDRDAYVAWIEKLGVDAVAADEHRFLERSRTRAYVIDERSSAG